MAEQFRSTCQLCPWVSVPYPTRGLAGCRATWHVFEDHPTVWSAMFGSVPPVDPDPRLLKTMKI